MKGYSVQEATEHFLLACRAEAKSQQTIRWYRQKLAYFTTYLGGDSCDLAEITRDQIRAFLRHLQLEIKSGQNNPHRPEESKPLSGHTVHGYARTLRAFFSWAERDGIIQSSPMKGMKMPKLPSLVVPSFADHEVKCLLDPASYEGAMKARNHTMIVVLLDTGIRVSELVGLQMGDLHLEEGYFTILGKGNKERNVPMGRKCRSAVETYLLKERPEPATPMVRNVFLSQHGTPLTQDWVYKILAGLCHKTGMRDRKVGPHTCRHTFAKRFLMNGGDLLTLQRILGHTSLEVVRMYVNLDTQDLLAQQKRFSPVDRFDPSSRA